MGEKNSRSFYWKFLERFGVTGVQFVLQIILARILEPGLYGILGIMIVFTSLANVFVQNGFNTALIQNKDVKEEDYSSVFWVSFVVAFLLYVLIFLSAPFIGRYYENSELVEPLRVLALMLFPGALNSVQLAKISREMDFKKVFYSNIGAILISGIAGIVIAYCGGGLWALVAQTLLNIVVACIVMRFTVKLKLRFKCDLRRVGVLFSFGWKLLVSSLIDTLYQDIRSLIIGKKYNEETLGYYTRGKQFPQFIVNAVNGAVQSVMLPIMSKEQDDKETVKKLMRSAIGLNAYVMFPIMAGLAAVATPLVSWILTDKWLPCVPYMQLYCFTLAFYPVHSCNLQAINAIGRSDIFLKLEIIKKTYGLIILAIAVFCFDSPLAIAATGLITTWIGWFVNAYPNVKLIKYTYWEQISDLLPAIVLSLLMCVSVLFAGNLISERFSVAPWVLTIIQVVIGIALYVGLSFIVRPPAFRMLLAEGKRILKKKEA